MELALDDPKVYSAALISHRRSSLYMVVHSVLVFFNFLFDPEKDLQTGIRFGRKDLASWSY